MPKKYTEQELPSYGGMVNQESAKLAATVLPFDGYIIYEMARGLSYTQKIILKVISDLPEGSELHGECYPVIKGMLFPELFFLKPFTNWRSKKVYWPKFPGLNTQRKACARVVISKSVRRLEKRGYLMIKTESKDINIPKRTFRGKTIPGRFFTEDRTCIYITPSGRQIVNG
ncbi:MAG: hypothetical protein Q7J06_11720 [Bacteroidales bacterium]|nr:hypothetical protein [Bacteroidales bacterium]